MPEKRLMHAVILLTVAGRLAIEAGALPTPGLEGEAIRGSVLDRLEKLPMVYFGDAYELALVTHFPAFRRTRCRGFQVCRLLITPEGHGNLSAKYAPAAQLFSVEGAATIRLHLLKSAKTIPLTPGRSAHDWQVNGKKYEFFAISLEGPGSTAFSFLFFSRDVPVEKDGKQLVLEMERLSGTSVLDVKVRRRAEAGDSGPAPMI